METHQLEVFRQDIPHAPALCSRELLVFNVGAEQYGVDIRHVQELRQYETPTALANAPSFVKGVINLRGEIVPILDLRLRLGFGVPVYDACTTVVILEFASRKIGAVVDGVSDVVLLAAEQLRPVPDIHAAACGLLLDGIGVKDAGLLLLVDAAALVSLEFEVVPSDASHR